MGQPRRLKFKIELGVFADGDVMPQLYLGERDVPDIDSVCEGCSYEAEVQHYFAAVAELCDDMRNVAGAAWEDCFWTCTFEVWAQNGCDEWVLQRTTKGEGLDIDVKACTMCDAIFLPDDCERLCSQCTARGY